MLDVLQKVVESSWKRPTGDEEMLFKVLYGAWILGIIPLSHDFENRSITGGLMLDNSSQISLYSLKYSIFYFIYSSITSNWDNASDLITLITRQTVGSWPL